jgi:hypothetical protein
MGGIVVGDIVRDQLTYRRCRLEEDLEGGTDGEVLAPEA